MRPLQAYFREKFKRFLSGALRIKCFEDVVNIRNERLIFLRSWEMNLGEVVTNLPCGEMKPLRVMSIHKSVCVTSFNDVLTEARGNIYVDSTLISYVI